jgi:MFS family permease
VKGLSLVSFFNDISSEMIYPLLPAFLTRTLGAGATLLGAIDGAAQLASALLNWVSGRLSDRPGLRKPLILVGYGTAVLVRPLISTAIAAWQVVGLRVLDRVGKGLRSAPRDALLAESTPPELHGRAFGMNRAADHAGAVLGALIGGWALAASVEVRTIIAWSAAPGIIAFVVLSVVLKGARSSESGGVSKEAAAPGRDSPPHPSKLTTPVVLLSLFALARLPELLVILRLQELGVAAPLIPFAWAALHVIRSSASYPAGRLNDRIGPDLLIGAGAAVFALCLTLLGKPLPAAWGLGVFVLLGLVAAFTEPAERALVAKLSPKGLGKGFGLYYALTGVAALPAAVLFGWIYEHQGASDALWLSGALVGATGLYWIWSRAAERRIA